MSALIIFQSETVINCLTNLFVYNFIIQDNFIEGANFSLISEEPLLVCFLYIFSFSFFFFFVYLLFYYIFFLMIRNFSFFILLTLFIKNRNW